MKLVQIVFHFEFSDRIETILDDHEIENYLRVPMVEGKDMDGKHYGSKVFPGSSSLVMAWMEEEKSAGVIEDLRKFKEERKAHNHLQVLVLTVEQAV